MKAFDLDAFAVEQERQVRRRRKRKRLKDLDLDAFAAALERQVRRRGRRVVMKLDCGNVRFAFPIHNSLFLTQANLVRNDETGLWQCPFCLRDLFPKLSEVWSHFDLNYCPGQAVGVKCRLDNDCFAFLPTKLISDKQVSNPEERVKMGMTIYSRITQIGKL